MFLVLRTQLETSWATLRTSLESSFELEGRRCRIESDYLTDLSSPVVSLSIARLRTVPLRQVRLGQLKAQPAAPCAAELLDVFVWWLIKVLHERHSGTNI